MSNYRYMRSLLFFDLPVETSAQRKEYRRFVKFLKKNGFIMVQESVYCKLSVTPQAVQSLSKLIEMNCPCKGGSVMMLTVTEKQFSGLQIFIGQDVIASSKIVNSDERYIEL